MVGVRHTLHTVIVKIGCEIIDMNSLGMCLSLTSTHGRKWDGDAVTTDARYKGGRAG